MKILITGAAGFIGFHLALRLIHAGYEVVGLDNLNDYYDPKLKYARLQNLGVDIENSFRPSERSSLYENFQFIKLDLCNKESILSLFKAHSFDAVCNLAAQAGVRHSLENPSAYIDSNITGFMNILEGCRNFGVTNLSFASSSSVYGLNSSVPFSTSHSVDHPISLYAASKKANELMAHTYAHLFSIATTGLRFFTVYGPWGRPDMALFLFTKAALEGKTINVFNDGDMLRDFTYIDDIVEGLKKVIDSPATPSKNWTEGGVRDISESSAPYKIYNIGNNNPVKLLDFIQVIESELGINIKKEFLPLQEGDVQSTYANIDDLIRDHEFKPNTKIQDGIKNFLNWYKEYYGH
jgi:UDP-glucuronate 4-epimerase